MSFSKARGETRERNNIFSRLTPPGVRHLFVRFSTYVNSDVDCPKNVSMVIGTPWHGVVALENFYFSSQTATDVSDLKAAVSVF